MAARVWSSASSQRRAGPRPARRVHRLASASEAKLPAIPGTPGGGGVPHRRRLQTPQVPVPPFVALALRRRRAGARRVVPAGVAVDVGGALRPQAHAERVEGRGQPRAVRRPVQPAQQRGEPLARVTAAAAARRRGRETQVLPQLVDDVAGAFAVRGRQRGISQSLRDYREPGFAGAGQPVLMAG
eukprot:gene21638-biopygen8671